MAGKWKKKKKSNVLGILMFPELCVLWNISSGKEMLSEYMGEVVERCTIAHFRTFITSNPCRIVECSSFLYFSVPMYRKQLGLSENIYLCSLSLDFLAVIAFQSSKNHENSDFPVKFTYISFSSFLKSHFTAHCEFCALPHTSQFKYQILLECLDAKSRAPGKAE